MLDHAQAFLTWVAAHPGLALALLFAVSLLDALFLVGAFVPASLMLFAVGALVALGSLELWPTAAIAAAGALIGDGCSFWLGRRYGERLFQSRLLLRYPEIVDRGRHFFDRHGGKGVWLARFLGPVRAITPAIAGASGMSVWVFLIADYSAAYVWALVYILPGVLFGASMGLAAEVATRLAGLLVLLFALGLLGLWLVPLIINGFQRLTHRWVGPVLEWSRRHRHLGRFGAALADPDQPEMPALALVALTLIGFGALWLVVLAEVGSHPYPSPFDALVYQTLHDLQTPWGNAIAYAVAQLGSVWVYGPTALAVALVLVVQRKPRAAAHWVAAVGFGALISLGLHAVPIRLPPATYYHGGAAALPRDLVTVIVIYAFAAVLLATHRPRSAGRAIYAGASLLLTLILLARLYLGVEWLSLTLFALVIALLWMGALTLGYRQHRPESLPITGFLLPVLAVFGLSALLRWSQDGRLPERPRAADRVQTIAAERWWSGGYRELPLQRIDLRGRSEDAFDLQWAGELPLITQSLEAQGWKRLPSLAPSHLLRWLTTSSPIGLLPVLPQVHAGSHQQLALRLGDDPEEQTVIRLWPSGWQLDGGGPVWLGSLSAQRARTFYRLLRYPVTEPDRLVDFTAPPPYTQRQVIVDNGSRTGSLWLVTRGASPYTTTYTAPYSDAPLAAPRPLPATEAMPPPPASTPVAPAPSPTAQAPR